MPLTPSQSRFPRRAAAVGAVCLLAGLLWFFSRRANVPVERKQVRSVEELRAREGGAGGQGSVSSSGVFTKREPDFVTPDYRSAQADVASLRGKVEETLRNGKPGALQIGLVEIDQDNRRLSFPAWLNLRSGLLEYAVVNSRGKVHEALFTTDASPLHVHVAALLLRFAQVEGGGVPGRVGIEVEWQPNGPPQRVPLESLIARAKGVPLDPVAARSRGAEADGGGEEPGESLEAGPWFYSGSVLRQGALMAEAEGSIISLVSDPSALVSNPRPGNQNDRLHVPARQLPPAANFPVVIHIQWFSEKESVTK